jgi:hypothetical protein
MSANIFDIDSSVQSLFNKSLRDLQISDWKDWATLEYPLEFEERAFEITGIDYNDWEKHSSNGIGSKGISVNPDELNSHYEEPIFLCHSSGTSGGNISNLKWFRYSKDTIRRLWAPGMNAIFESSGLKPSSTVVIFVPSRIEGDGLQINNDKQIRLYSSEFSQRIVLSTIRPKNYLIDFYKNSRSLETISNILSLDKVDVISAPYKTILGWIDLDILSAGLKKSYNETNDTNKAEELKELINKNGILNAAKKIQKLLSDKIKDSTLIFSISTLNVRDWVKVREFFGWKKGEENFTNLYVGSEIGPFSASIDNSLKQMVVFPLSIPVLKKKNLLEPITRTKFDFGRLFISRNHNGKPVFNIDTGDVIALKRNDGPLSIGHSILREGFRLKDSNNLGGEVFVGDYFDLKEFEIISPRELISCLEMSFDEIREIKDPLVLEFSDTYKLFIPLKDIEKSLTKSIEKEISKCKLGGKNLNKVISEHLLKIELHPHPEINKKQKKNSLIKVQSGKIPKGALKKWPFYYIKKAK